MGIRQIHDDGFLTLLKRLELSYLWILKILSYVFYTPFVNFKRTSI